MAKFNYKFQPIIKVKETQEKEVQKEITIIENEIHDTKSKITEIQNQKELLRSEIRAKKKISSTELQFSKKVELSLDASNKKMEMDLEILNIKKSDKLEELLQRSKEHKIFEKLEEIHKENFLIEENRSEQIKTDEIALTKYKKTKL